MVVRLDLVPAPGGDTAVMLGERRLAVGVGALVCQSARVLVAEGHDPGQRLEAWRGDMLSLSGPIGVFAKLTVENDRFVPYRSPVEGPRKARNSLAGSSAEAEGTIPAGDPEKSPAGDPHTRAET